MTRSVRRLIGAATAAVFAAAALPAITTAQGSDIIYACFKTQSGQVRFVSAPSACLASETAIPLNQTGVQGPQGAEGPEGPQGPPGPPGPADLLPPVGEFTPMQLVQGAILTCTSTIPIVGFVVTCDNPKLNGMDIGGMNISDNISLTNRLCATITGERGHSFSQPNAPTTNPKFSWTGTAWALSSALADPLIRLSCFR